MKGNDSDGFEMLGDPGQIERLGGADFDDRVFRRVAERFGTAFTTNDVADMDALEALSALRQECVAAKETLSFRSEASVLVTLPGGRATARLVRTEFEAMIDGSVRETVDMLQQTLDRAGLAADDLDAVLLVGGSSHIPFVQRKLAEEFGRLTVIAPDPMAALALGAAALGARGVIATRVAEAGIEEQAVASIAHTAPAGKTRRGVRRPVSAIAGHRFRPGPQAIQAAAKAIPVGAAAIVAGLILTVVAAQGAGFTSLSLSDNATQGGEWFMPESLRSDILGFPFKTTASQAEATTDAAPFLEAPPAARAPQPGAKPNRGGSETQARQGSPRPASPQQAASTNPRHEPPPAQTADTDAEPAPEPPADPVPDPDPPLPPDPDPNPEPNPDPAPDPDPLPDPEPDPAPDPAPEPPVEPPVDPPVDPIV